MELDWAASPEHDFRYLSDSDQDTTSFPANCDDDALMEDGAIVSHSIDIHTVSLTRMESANQS